MTPWLVFYGTCTALVWAEDAPGAFDAFIGLAFPLREYGRVAPPGPDEVHVRALTPDDRGWIEDTDAPRAWTDALRGLSIA